MNGRAAYSRASDAALWLAGGDRLFVRILVAALALRLALLPWFSDPYNFRVFELTASMVEADQNPWVLIAWDPALAAVNPWGYPPLYLAPVLAASALSMGDGMAFGILIRLPLIVASLLTAVFMQRTALAMGLPAERARAVAALYAFNPFVVLIDTVWGANDPLPIACVAASFYYFVRASPRLDLSALFLGLGIAFKLYPVVLLPVALAGLPSWKARGRFLALAAVPGALSAGPLLLASPAQLFQILGVFVVSSSGGPNPLTFPYLIAGLTGAADLPATLLVAPFLVALGAVAFLHARGKGTPLTLWAVTLLLLFLAAPRLGENYFLWPVSALTLCAALLPWHRISRAAGVLLWVPIIVSTFIFNGAGGVTGVSYWAHAAGAPVTKPYLFVPAETRLLLTGAVVAMLFVAAVGLLRVAWGAPQGEGAPQARQLLPQLGRLLQRSRTVLAAGTIAFLLALPAASAAARPVQPEDFGTYTFPDGNVRYTEEFRSGLIDQTWSFEGSGAFQLDAAGRGALALDTRVPRGNAYLTRPVPNETVDVEVTLRVERLDGSPGLLLVSRIPGGWIGVRANATAPQPASYSLLFFNEHTNASHRLGAVALGEWFSFGYTAGPEHSEVRFGNSTVSAVAMPITRLLFGQRDAGLELGGRLSIDSISATWQAPPRAASPGLYIALLGLGGATLAVPLLWWRRFPT